MPKMSKNEKKTCIAISGTMASGKSTVLSYLNQLGYPTINCDIINAQLQRVNEKGYLKIVESFGQGILNDNKEIDRKKLANKIFHNVEKKKVLERIMHPLILEEIFKMKEKYSYLFVEVPLLYELGWEKYFDEHWLITCNETLCYERCIKNRNMTLDEVKARLNHQMSRESKMQKANVIIENNGDIQKLYKEIDLLLERIKNE